MKPTDKEAKLPVCVIGAGLSAADAIIMLRNKNIKVIHVYRSVAAGFVSFVKIAELTGIISARKNSDLITKVCDKIYTFLVQFILVA